MALTARYRRASAPVVLLTGLAGVPTLGLLAQPNSTLQKQPLPDERYITKAGGAMQQVLLATLRQALPTRVFLMYGLTEVLRSTYLPSEEFDRRPTSIGKALPDTQILVLNEDGQPCRPGEIGELVHRGADSVDAKLEASGGHSLRLAA